MTRPTRPVRVEDAGAIAAVHVAAWQSAYRGIVPDDVLNGLDVRRRAADWAGILGDESQQTLVIEDEGAVCGFASFGPGRDDDAGSAGEVYAIYVDPACWRRGLGRQLWEATRAALVDAGFREATLWVFEANAPARRFYEHVGFLPDGARNVETRGAPLEVVRYRRWL